MDAPDVADPLPGLPGASPEPGSGPAVEALFEGLYADAAGDVTAHRGHRSAWYADLVGPLVLEVGGGAGLAAVERLQAAATSADHGQRLLLAAAPDAGADGGLDALRQARNLLLDDDRVELVGVVPLVPAGHVGARAGAEVARAVLAALDFSAPAWLELPLGPGWAEALDVVVQDGAEHVAVRVPHGGRVDDLAAFVRRAVDLDVSFRVVGADDSGAVPPGVAVLCGVRAALNGAEAPEVAAILGERRPALLVSALRRMSEADAAVARAFVTGVHVPDVARTVEALRDLDLVAAPPD